MAVRTSTESPAVARAAAAKPVAWPAWQRWLIPSFQDLLFISLISWLFLFGAGGWDVLVNDADVGWHIRTGEHVWQTRSVPHTDLFSWSKPGATWFAWEWLSDLAYAGVHALQGLKGVVLLGGTLIATTYLLLLRYMVWRGANPVAALAFGLVAIGASSMHFLARPHLFSLLFLLASLWLLVRDRRTPDRRVWWLVPLTVVWTNLHGAFPVLLLVLALQGVGGSIEAWWNGAAGAARWRPLARYGLLGTACLAASLVNPYGWALHGHILSYMQSSWIQEVVQEFQAPGFRAENERQFELLLLVSLLMAGQALRRRQVVEPLWVVMFAHLALTSVRHAPLFALVAAPLAADEVSRHWEALRVRLGKRATLGLLAQVGEDLRPGFQRATLWPVVFIAALAMIDEPIRWPRDFPARLFPTRMVTEHQELLARSRVLTTDQWGDYLIYRSYPRQRVFIDGRSDFYGPELGREYVALGEAGARWPELMRKHRFDVVLCPPGWSLAAALKREPGWELKAQDARALLFVRRGERDAATSGQVH